MIREDEVKMGEATLYLQQWDKICQTPCQLHGQSLASFMPSCIDGFVQTALYVSEALSQSKPYSRSNHKEIRTKPKLMELTTFNEYSSKAFSV